MSTRSLNKVMLIGNLTRDPSLRYTPKGTAVCSFSIATNRTWQPTDGGERQEDVEFHNCVAWGKLAEICGQLLHKGDKAYVDGRLQTRDWQTKEGDDRRTTEIILENMMLLVSRSGASDDSSYTASDDNSSKSSSPAKNDDDDYSDEDAPEEVEDISDDIPF